MSTEVNEALRSELSSNLARKKAQAETLDREYVRLVDNSFHSSAATLELMSKHVRKNAEKTYHWLETESGDLMWRRGYGPIKGRLFHWSGVKRREYRDSLVNIRRIPNVLRQLKIAIEEMEVAQTTYDDFLAKDQVNVSRYTSDQHEWAVSAQRKIRGEAVELSQQQKQSPTASLNENHEQGEGIDMSAKQDPVIRNFQETRRARNDAAWSNDEYVRAKRAGEEPTPQVMAKVEEMRKERRIDDAVLATAEVEWGTAHAQLALKDLPAADRKVAIERIDKMKMDVEGWFHTRREILDEKRVARNIVENEYADRKEEEIARLEDEMEQEESVRVNMRNRSVKL